MMPYSLSRNPPVGGAPRDPRAPAVVAPAAVERASRILVVDDDVDGADLMAMALRSMGYDVEIAPDGAAALQAMVTFSPDAALLDIGLPGMDGYELSHRIHADARFAGVPLVALTGYDGRADVLRAREAGFAEHVGKPVSLDRLELTLATLLAARH